MFVQTHVLTVRETQRNLILPPQYLVHALYVINRIVIHIYYTGVLLRSPSFPFSFPLPCYMKSTHPILSITSSFLLGGEADVSMYIFLVRTQRSDK